MKFSITVSECQEIFDSIDIDGSGAISLPEFMADFNTCCERSEEDLIREEHAKRNDQR